MNTTRPYTYSHQDQLRSYTHYGQSLAHPLGANFREILGIARYQAGPRLLLEGKSFLWKRGYDTPGQNYGGDTWKPYTTRVAEYGNYIGQGNASVVRTLSLDISYMLAHNLYIDLNTTFRKDNSVNDAFDTNTKFGTIGVRWNSWRRRDVL